IQDGKSKRGWVHVTVKKYLSDAQIPTTYREGEVWERFCLEDELSVMCYTDASFQTDRDNTKSQSGYVLIMNDGAVAWMSSKQDTIAMSSTELEYIIVLEAAKTTYWMKKFIEELGVVPNIENPVKDLKIFLTELPTLTALIPRETLTLYPAASQEAIASVLLEERNMVQKPIHFFSKVIQAVLPGSLDTCPYRQTTKTVNGKIMADFLTEVDTSATVIRGKKSTTHAKPMGHDKKRWTLHTHGASSKAGLGVGLLLRSSSGHDFTYALKFDFEASNNKAEYVALLEG
ncbi:hypothetical protein Tco_1196609, partial [Tanacetum coccineum]